MATFQSAEGGRLLEVGLYLFGSTQMIKFDGWFRRRTLHVPNLLEETGTIFAAWKYENEVIKGYETIYFLSISHDRLNDYGQHTWPFKFEDFVLSNYMYMYSKHNDPIITTRFHCKRNFALWKFRQGEFSPCEVSRVRIFAMAKFQKTKFRFSGCEISFDSTKIR